MTIFFLVMFIVFVFTAATACTWLLYHYARKKKLLAIPNERSSHSVPIPTGAGLAIVVVFLVAVLFLGFWGILQRNVVWALIGGGSIIALVGWVDIHRPLKARYRIVVHTLAALWALWQLYGFPFLNVGFTTLPLGGWGVLVACLGIVTMSNLYNFMDGIDGLVASEAMVVGGVAGGLLWYAGAGGLALATWALAASAAGFLIWNWHPAKIFMGDVGSVFLGFIFATLAVASENAHALPAFVLILLLLIVIVDAGFTTIRRAFNGDRWFEAHRTFSYQRAVQSGYSHSQVVLRVMGMNGVLALLAILVFLQPRFLLPVMSLSLALLSWIWWKVQGVKQ